MLFHQLARGGSNDRQYPVLHEVAVPGIELASGVARQWFQLKVEKLVYIQRAGFVLLVELHVASLVDLPVQHALLDEELRPLEIAVPGQQGIVEIEQGQIHDAACNNSRTSGTVILRRLANA